MSFRDNAKYVYGLPFVRIMPLNDNYSIPTPLRMLGDIGPFDFSEEANPAAIPLTTKIDNNAAETVTIDLSGVVDIENVTVDELVDAINAANPTDITASEDVTTGRILLAYDASDVVRYVQVYNRVAIIARFGQGFGLRFRRCDTFRSLGETPVAKDEERIVTTDAEGRDTAVITDGYRQGVDIGAVDTANDWDLRSVFEGGHYNNGEDGNPIQYDVPTSEDKKCYFYLEAFFKVYTRGENEVGALVGYIHMLVRSCKATVGDKTHEAGFSDDNFTIKGVSYKDENNILYADTTYYELTKEEFKALDVFNV
jgi:hypothetical protein